MRCGRYEVIRQIHQSAGQCAPSPSSTVLIGQLRLLLEPEAAAPLIRDFDAFGAEASSAEPRQGSLSRIGDDLVQTAAKVPGVAAPLIALVERVVSLFPQPPPNPPPEPSRGCLCSSGNTGTVSR